MGLKYLLIYSIVLLSSSKVTLNQDVTSTNGILDVRLSDPVTGTLRLLKEELLEVNNSTMPLSQESKKRFDPLLRIPMTATTATPGNLYLCSSHMNSLFAFDKLLGPVAEMIPNPSKDTQNYLAHYKYLKQDIANIKSDEEIPDSISGNPLHVYALIKRLVQFSEAVFEELNSKRSYNNTDLHAASTNVYAAHKLITLPDMEDLSGSGLALSRLAHVYRLNIDHMTKGILQSVHSSVRLSALDCFHISIESLYLGQYTSAYLWNEKAIKLTEDPELRSVITSHLNKIIIKHDENWRINEFFFPKRLSESRTQEIYDTPWNKLCRGIQNVNAIEKSRLFCHINDRGNPYLKLMPVRYEELQHDPELYMFYDVISPSESEVVKNCARDRLERSDFGAGVNGGSAYSSDVRVSQHAFVDSASDPVIANLGRRVQDVTGLLTFESDDQSELRTSWGSDPLKVLNYGIGGQFLDHYDTIRRNLDINIDEEWANPPSHWSLSGERIATWMYIIKAPLAGGHTAFPLAGVSVKPVTGAALFWYNTKRNGKAYLSTKHGGCPVLLGHKWIANKFIREKAQHLRRPCSLDPEA